MRPALLLVFAAVALGTTGCTLLSVSPGRPEGPTFRMKRHAVTIVETNEPEAPRLQPNQPAGTKRQAALLFVPLDGSGRDVFVPIAHDVSASSLEHTVRILGVEPGGERVVFEAGDGGVKSAAAESGGSVRGAVGGRPQAGGVPAPESYFFRGFTMGDGAAWLGLYGDKEEMPKAGERLWPGAASVGTGSYPLRGMGVDRRLMRIGIDRSGVLPRVGSASRVAEVRMRNAVFVAGSERGLVESTGGAVLVAYETGTFPQTSLQLARLKLATGAVEWQVDTGIGKLEQVLFGDRDVILRGEPVRQEKQFPQPFLAVVQLETGRIFTRRLEWPTAGR